MSFAARIHGRGTAAGTEVELPMPAGQGLSGRGFDVTFTAPERWYFKRMTWTWHHKITLDGEESETSGSNECFASPYVLSEQGSSAFLLQYALAETIKSETWEDSEGVTHTRETETWFTDVVVWFDTDALIYGDADALLYGDADALLYGTST